jgi:hypothetical protein
MPVRRTPKPTATRRATSNRVATSPGCEPLREMYAKADATKPKSWNAIEDDFLRASERFDGNLVSRVADMGDLQNGKGDFFNDLVALLLEGCADVELFSRTLVPGFIYPTHNLDVTYPGGVDEVARFLVEAKAVGVPKWPGNPRQKQPLGRPGSADIRKRVAEVSFKTIDLKAEHGRIEAMRGQRPTTNPGGNLTTWLRAASPKTFLFISARVISESDLRAIVAYAGRAAQVVDGVGLFCYEPLADDQPTRYRSVSKGIPTELQLDRVLYRACEDLRAIPTEPPIKMPEAVLTEAVEVETLGKEADA